MFFDFVYLIIPKQIINLRIQLYADQWLFVIGCNNSGTTLLKTIIESHPNVIGIEGEGQYRTKKFVTDRDIRLNRLFSEKLDVFRNIKQVDPLKVKYDWIISLLRRKTKRHRYILEKTTVNSVRIPWLIKHFPNARFVVIFREAYGVVEGMKRKEGIDVHRGTAHWNKTNTLIMDDLAGKNDVLYLKYEDLSDSPQIYISQIWEFLGLPDNSPIQGEQKYKVHGKSSTISNQNAKSKEQLTAQELSFILKSSKEVQTRIYEYCIKD